MSAPAAAGLSAAAAASVRNPNPWAPWPMDVKESSLRIMRLNPKLYKDRFQLVVDWISRTVAFMKSPSQMQQAAKDNMKQGKQKTRAAALPSLLGMDHEKPSLSMQYAMALLLLRILAGNMQRHHLVGDLMQVYFRLVPQRRDWSVVATARWCLHVLDESPQATATLLGYLYDSTTSEILYSRQLELATSALRPTLLACCLQAEQAAMSFYDFWNVWDTMCPIVLNRAAGYRFPSADASQTVQAAAESESASEPPAAAPAAVSIMDATTGAAVAPPPTATTPNKKPDPSHNILIVAWKLACLVPAQSDAAVTAQTPLSSGEHPLLGPTAAFCLLLAIAYWNRADNGDDAAATTGQFKQVLTTPGGRIVVPPVNSATFLLWLVETVQMRAPATRPYTASTASAASPAASRPRLTVEKVQRAMRALLTSVVLELEREGGAVQQKKESDDERNKKDENDKMDVDGNNKEKEQQFENVFKQPKKADATAGDDKDNEKLETEPATTITAAGWLQDLQDVMGRTGHVTPTTLYDKIGMSLVFLCGRLMRDRVCDVTHLVDFYLETGRNPAVAMNAAMGLYNHHSSGSSNYNTSQDPRGVQSTPGVAPPPPVSSPRAMNNYTLIQTSNAKVARVSAAAPTTMTTAPPPPVMNLYPQAQTSKATMSRVSAAAPTTVTTAPPPHAIPAKRGAGTAAANSRLKKTKVVTGEPEFKGKLELTLNPQELAAAMELAVAETKKLDEASSSADILVTTTTNANSVTPPVISEAMELTEWSVSLLSIDTVKPSRKLRKYLESATSPSDVNQQWADVMIPILNRTLLKLIQEALPRGGKTQRAAPVSVLMEPDAGLVQIHGDVTADKQLGQAVIALYYHALEAVLFVESARLNVTSHPQIVLYPVFHRALLACCCWCVTKAIGVTQKLRASPSLQAIQIHSTLHVTGSNPYDFLKVSESFMKSLTAETARGKLGSPLIFALPRLLQKDLRQIETNVADSLLWARSAKTDGSLPGKIEEFQEKTDDGNVTLWPPEVLAPKLQEELEDLEQYASKLKDPVYPTPDHDDYAEYRCVNFMMRKIVKLAFFRLEALCRFLDVPMELAVATQAWVAFRYLVRYRVELLYDRHVDHWILCCLYGISKSMKYRPELTFARIIEAYVVVRGPELGDVTCQRIVRHVKIEQNSNDPSNSDNIIALYNRVFVPEMKHHLLGSKSLSRSASELPEQLAALRGEEEDGDSRYE